LIAMVLFGVWRLDTHPTHYTQTKVRIVQANVAQSLKWDPAQILAGLRKHVTLTTSSSLDSINLVLWPETAVPYYIASQTGLTEDLGSILPKDGLLITGGLRGNDYDHSESWNSMFAIDATGKIVTEYDKHHLVPFGEYVPFRWLPPVQAIAAQLGVGDFKRGLGPTTLNIDPYPPFSPLICYEAIFPGEATDETGHAQWLFSLTDDAWFGYSSGPVQDMQMARTRAVEQGLPLLRAANTGISAGFDAYGRIIASLPLEKEGILDLYLPTEAHKEAIFGRYPESCILFMIAISLFFLFL
jgi:apolipoprotein N-acyltransferase